MRSFHISKKFVWLWIMGIMLLLLPSSAGAKTPVSEKVAVLITGWGMPAGYNFEYSWNSHTEARVGDRTHYPGELCKIGHVGEFPYQTHVGILPWGLTTVWPGGANIFDTSGIYKLVNGAYVSVNPDLPSLTPSLIPAGIPVIPLVEVKSPMTGELMYAPDPRTGEDHLAGWYQIGSPEAPFPNGCGEAYEGSPPAFIRWNAMMGSPTELPEAYLPPPIRENKMVLTHEMLDKSFGDKIDVRFGVYDKITGYSEQERDVAEEFATEGFRKMLLARETTDNNNYADEFMTGNFVKERLCELGVLDETEIYLTKQVGRTPEFNSMNIVNFKDALAKYPEGSKIGIVYVTRGLPWKAPEGSWLMGRQHPFSKEVYHENAYLNYLSWKKALQKVYGDRYDLVFTSGGVESDIREDNFFTYGVNTEDENAGVFLSIRDAIQLAKADGLDKLIIAPCHWLYDAHDVLFIMREGNKLPIPPVENLQAGVYEYTHCEDMVGSEVTCGTAGATEITTLSAYSHLDQEFATAYYVILRGTLERFGLYPKETNVKIQASQLVTKLLGGTVEVNASDIKGAKIEIPADPYPDRPDSFTPDTEIPPNDPGDTNDSLWEDTVINIGHQTNPPAMKSAKAAGPAVHFGPYRNFFNRDVTITIPYSKDEKVGSAEAVKVYIYNHLTDDWDPIDPDSVDQTNRLVTFKTQVLGLFRVGVEK